MYLRICLRILFYLFLFYMYGTDLLLLIGQRQQRVERKIAVGFFVYYFVFFLMTIPLKALGRPLHLLCAVWIFITAAAAVLFLFLQIREKKKARPKASSDASMPRAQRIYRILAVLLVLAQCVFYETNDFNGALWDEAYYVGDAASSVYSDTISGVDPYTGGEVVSGMKRLYFLETYQNEIAMMSMLFHMDPVIEAKSVCFGANFLVFFLTASELGMTIFRRDRKKTALFLLLLSALFSFSYNTHFPAQMLIFRGYEGKSVLANTAILFFIYEFLRLGMAADEPVRCGWSGALERWSAESEDGTIRPFEDLRLSKKKRHPASERILLMIAAAGSCSICMSGIYIVPLTASAYMLPAALVQRRKGWLLSWLLLCASCVPAAGVFLLMKGVLS